MKMLRRSYVSMAFAAVFAFAACQKDATNTTTNTDNSYSPSTTGSTWTYRDQNNATYTITATNRDTVALGRTYKVYTNSAGGSNYMARDGADYYRFAVIPALGPNGFDELYLKDNLAVNGTWSSVKQVTIPGTTTTVPANLNYGIKSKGSSRTVNNRSYNNVIHVELGITVAGMPLGTGNFYYAEGVGLIESALNINSTIFGNPAITEASTLVSYDIK